MDYSFLKYRVEPVSSSCGDEYPVDPDLVYSNIRYYLLFRSRGDDFITIRSKCDAIARAGRCRVIWL